MMAHWYVKSTHVDRVGKTDVGSILPVNDRERSVNKVKSRCHRVKVKREG